MGQKEQYKNHLEGTKDPYLLQHVGNPVDWYPWGEEAFRRARELDRPIFLSIGYSTCHWCHVMAHESFEDGTVAEAMNRTFVSIKVDREERPDLDAVFMKAAHLAIGKGGWPLTVVMTPEKEPFFFGTYLPRTARFGTMGMLDLCSAVERIWKDNRSELLSTVQSIKEVVLRSKSAKKVDIGEGTLKDAFSALAHSYDTVNGGFGDRPKFPSPHQLIFLIRYWWATGEEKALDMAVGTLKAMRHGGLFDHVGGGFHRYSTDEKWVLPHFEKMLYDQAMMVLAYTEAYQATGEPLFKDTIERTVLYMIEDLRGDDDLFMSSEDADSEGEEGLFYLWTTSEAEKVLGKARASEFIKAFSMSLKGNFREESTQRRTGRNVLHFGGPGDILGFRSDLEKLRAVRKHRIRPFRDDKVLLDWNALAVSALSRAGSVLGREDLIGQAKRTMDALLADMRSDGGGPLHSMVGGKASVDGFLDDHAFLIQGLLDLYEGCFDARYMKEAVRVSKKMRGSFLDGSGGGFFLTSERHEKLLFREKDAYDGAMPSGNSTAALSLIRLSRMTGDPQWEDLSWGTMRAFSDQLRRAPSAYAYMLCALLHAIGQSREVVVSGRVDGEDTKDLMRALRDTYFPSKVVILKVEGKEGQGLSDIAPFTREAEMIKGKATAYVCKGGSCDVPTTDPEALRTGLRTVVENISFK
ncbi:MAG: thioredoxin domain-containing protein [Candidatus Thermoplasmatota archaeon]|jgi:hypothetical protein|nr:thioredoxin domain-containing protein [Candidatus Thermoplasmatota archaeon]